MERPDACSSELAEAIDNFLRTQEGDAAAHIIALTTVLVMHCIEVGVPRVIAVCQLMTLWDVAVSEIEAERRETKGRN